MEPRSLLPLRAPGGPAVVESERRRLARPEREVRELEDERDGLREDLALARSWVSILFAWIERGEPPVAKSASEPVREPRPLRRAATIAALVGAPWVLVGGGIAAGVTLF